MKGYRVTFATDGGYINIICTKFQLSNPYLFRKLALDGLAQNDDCIVGIGIGTPATKKRGGHATQLHSERILLKHITLHVPTERLELDPSRDLTRLPPCTMGRGFTAGASRIILVMVY